jgi:FMN-dependent NADH-azoreductase
MSILLKIDVSTRDHLSISRRLSALFLEQWREDRADGKVIERDIDTTKLSFLEFP